MTTQTAVANAYRHDERQLFKRVPVEWPGGARIGLVVVASFPPAAPASCRIARKAEFYARNAGIQRVMQVLDDLGLPASVAVGARLATEAPSLLAAFKQRQWEILACAAPGEEAGRAVAELRRHGGEAVDGWCSQEPSGEPVVPSDLADLAANRIRYVLAPDSDDLPFPIQAAGGTLFGMPYSCGLVGAGHSNKDYIDHLVDHFSVLWREAEYYGGRLMTVAAPCESCGQAHRIGAFRKALEIMTRHAGVWPTTCGRALQAYVDQSG